MLDVKVLQEEHQVWANYNFGPERQPSLVLLGITEEIGELSEPLYAFIEMEKNWVDVAEDIKDSLADMFIFSTDYCTGRGWDMKELYEEALRNSTKYPDYEDEYDMVEIEKNAFALMKALGKLCHHQLKSNQGIRGSAEEHAARGKMQLINLLSASINISTLLDISYLEEVFRVWGKVKQRDWKKNSKTADVGNG